MYHEDIAKDIRQKRAKLDDQQFNEYMAIMEENGLLSKAVLNLLQ